MGTSTEPRSSRLKDKKRSEGETIVKKLFVQTVIQNNDLLHILLEQESSCLLLPQNNSVCSNLRTGSKLKAKSKFSLLCSPNDEVGNSKTSAFGDICYGKSLQVTEMNDLLSEKQKPSFVCKSNSPSSLNKKSDHCGNGDICASTSEIEGINNENGSTPQYDGLVQGLFACTTCGISGFACAAVIQPREAATHYFASSDCRFLSDRSELTSCSGGIEKSDQNDLCDVQVQVQSGNCEDQVLNKGVEVVSDTKTQKVISSLDLLASLYGNPEEEQDESPMLVTADENSTEDSSSLCNRNDSSVSTSSHAISNIFPTAFQDTSKCSNADITGKNTNMLVKQRSDVDASRKYMFCLKHAFEVGKKLQPMGGAQMLLFCHPEYPRVETEAKLLAGELGINYVWKDIRFKEGTKEDQARIQSVQDDGKATPKDGDWTVKLGVNMGYSASLSLSPSSSNQIPYNLVMYKAFGRSSSTNSSVELMSKEESSKQKKISVAGKWCGKVWMSNQVHPFVAQRDTLEQEISVKLCSFATPELKDERKPTISDTRKEALLRIENSPQHMTDIITRQTGKKRKDLSVEEDTKKPKHLHREAAEDSPKTSSPPQHGRILRSRQKKCGIEPVLTIRQCDLRVKQEKEGTSGPSTRLRKRPLKFSEEVEVKPLRKKQSMKNGQKKDLSCSKKMKIKDEEECEVKSLRNKRTGKSGKKKALSCINDMPIKKEEEEYRCDIEGCTMGFSTKKALALHKRNICPIKGCAKKMFTHKYMMQHKKVHVDARPLRCPWKGCKMTFKWGWSRTEHIRVHTGARPYLCPEPGCGQTFRFVSDFSRHRRKMGHSVEKE